MICPNCDHINGDGTSVCSKCHATLILDKQPTRETFIKNNIEFEEVYQTLDSFDFIDAIKSLENAGVEAVGDKWYSGELHIDGQGRGQAPFVWKIFVPIGENENANAVLSGRMFANIGYADARMGPLKHSERKLFWSIAAVVALIWAVIIWKFNF